MDKKAHSPQIQEQGMGKAGSKIRRYITPDLLKSIPWNFCEVIRHLERTIKVFIILCFIIWRR